MTKLHLEPCPKCMAPMKFVSSDEFEGAINIRCSKCWLVFECTENSYVTAARLWNRNPTPAQPKADVPAGMVPSTSEALFKFVAALSESQFVEIAEGEDGETLLNILVGALGRLVDAEQQIALLQATPTDEAVLAERLLDAADDWAFNVMLECSGRAEDKIDVVMGGAILNLRDLHDILETIRARPSPGSGGEAGDAAPIDPDTTPV